MHFCCARHQAGARCVGVRTPVPRLTRAAAFRTDTVETALVGWTPLGHYELQRKRDRIALSEVYG